MGILSIFFDENPALTYRDQQRGIRAAQKAAREARSTVRTKRMMYRRYRKTAGDSFLPWPAWCDAYLVEYRGKISGGSSPDRSSDLSNGWR